MKSVQSKLPKAMAALAYMAAGLALSVSWAQLRQVLEMQGSLPSGEYIAVALPAAILFGACVLWRMAGHLFSRSAQNRSFGPAVAFVLFGAVFNEGVSIATSAMSLTMGVNEQISQDVQATDQYKATQATNQAAAMAAQRIGENIQNMPANYYTKGNESASQLTELLNAQANLAQTTNASTETTSSTARTMDEFGQTLGLTGTQLKTRWSWCLAICLSLIPMALQIGLGSLSDGAMTEKQARRDGGLFGGGGSSGRTDTGGHKRPKFRSLLGS